jgi:hypothetical protein
VRQPSPCFLLLRAGCSVVRGWEARLARGPPGDVLRLRTFHERFSTVPSSRPPTLLKTSLLVPRQAPSRRQRCMIAEARRPDARQRLAVPLPVLRLHLAMQTEYESVVHLGVPGAFARITSSASALLHAAALPPPHLATPLATSDLELLSCAWSHLFASLSKAWTRGASPPCSSISRQLCLHVRQKRGRFQPIFARLVSLDFSCFDVAHLKTDSSSSRVMHRLSTQRCQKQAMPGVRRPLFLLLASLVPACDG